MFDFKKIEAAVSQISAEKKIDREKLIDIIEHVDNIPNCKEEYKKHAQILDVIKTACNPTGILSDKNIEKAVKKAKNYNLDTIFLLESIEILNSRLKNNDS